MTASSHDDEQETMKHVDDETLSKLREGDLDEVRAADARAHLEACDVCRAQAQALDRMVSRLAEPPEEEIPPLLAGRLAETYGKPGDAARRTAWRWIPAVAGVAAVVAVAVVAVRLYAPGQLGGPAGAPPAAEKAAAPSGEGRSAEPQAGGETATADSAAGDGAEPRVLSAAAPTSALTAYAGPALPIPLFDMPRVGIDMAYVRAIVSQPGIMAYARRHAYVRAYGWSSMEGSGGSGRFVPGLSTHEALGLAAANDRELILAAVARGLSGVDVREAIAQARAAWPKMRFDGPRLKYGPSEVPIIWLARATWEPTGEQVWVVASIDVFSPIDGTFRVQALVLDSAGNALVRAGSGAETAAPLR